MEQQTKRYTTQSREQKSNILLPVGLNYIYKLSANDKYLGTIEAIVTTNRPNEEIIQLELISIIYRFRISLLHCSVLFQKKLLEKCSAFDLHIQLYIRWIDEHTQ